MEYMEDGDDDDDDEDDDNEEDDDDDDNDDVSRAFSLEWQAEFAKRTGSRRRIYAPRIYERKLPIITD